jgi:hypothetical protein
MGGDEARDRLRARLAEAGVPVSDDELEEMAAAQLALAGWIAAVERLAADWPAFAVPLPE